MTHPGTILVLAIHRSDPWWGEVARHLGFGRKVLVTDRRGRGDRNIVDMFYAARSLRKNGGGSAPLLDTDAIDDAISRCRVLRWVPRSDAELTVLATADVFAAILDEERPVAVTTWPIDCYIGDVLARMADVRGIPFFELTASPIPDMAMLVLRGKLLTHDVEPDDALVDASVSAIADPLFMPAYVPRKARYTRLRWLKTFAYFRARSLGFKLLSGIERDPLNLHYVDAQAWLGHKPKLGDIRALSMLDRDWQTRLEAVPKDKRLFVALQLFPEASIDYWIANRELIDHDEILVAAIAAFSQAGYTIFVKDHPLQFGFRKVDLFDRLAAIPNVVLVPYEVGGNALMAMVGLSLTETGTLGMQAAMMGMKSVTAEAYYYVPGDFVPLRGSADVPGLPAAVAAAPPCTDVPARRRRIVRHLLRGSFPGNFMSFRGFDPASPNPAVAELGRNLGATIAGMIDRTSR